MMWKFLAGFFILIVTISISIPYAQRPTEPAEQDEIDLSNEKHWVDSVLNSLSLEERIAQLLMIRVYSNRQDAYADTISQLIRRYNVGGLTFFQGGPVRQAQLINLWQTIARTPLLISIDAEWGLAMRLDSVAAFPRHMTLGAVQDNELVFQTGYEIGRQCRRAGIHMNFAPVVDVNSNPSNPVIGFRSFGEDPENVAAKGNAFIQGMQQAGVLATAKHFPGHGDTDTDSHYALPVLRHSMEHLQQTELVPFKAAINAGVSAIMSAHLHIPAIDTTRNISTSLSTRAVNELLKNELKFEGLAVTDALDMDAVARHFPPGKRELQALLAGNDILLLPTNVPAAISAIKNAVATGVISEEMINERCRKVLATKFKLGLHRVEPISLPNLTRELNSPAQELITRQIFENAITVVKNNHQLIPISRPDTLRIASLAIGSRDLSPFQKRLSSYAPVVHHNTSTRPDRQTITNLLKKLKEYNLIIVSIESTSQFLSKNYGIQRETIELISQLKTLPAQLIVNLSGNPYSLNYFSDHQHIDALIVSYEDHPVAKDLTAQVIFGAIGAKGRLPVTASPDFPVGSGVDTPSIGRLKFTIPEEVQINRQDLDIIIRIIEDGIRQKAYPGCQVLVAFKGKVFFHQAFGHHTYDKNRSVQPDDLYDLASLTKILATTPAMMLLVQNSKVQPDQTLYPLLPYMKNSAFAGESLRKVMAHQAGFAAWIDFQKLFINGQNPGGFSLVTTPSPRNLQVARDLYIDRNFRQFMLDSISNSRPSRKNQYLYSDLGFILLGDLIERITGQSLDSYITEKLYRPMGLPTIGYNPLQRFDKNRIVPTEDDKNFRKQLIHGTVHDQNASLMGGVAGHAGLFATATDVAAIMQMFLQNGYYGGIQFIEPQLVKEFTRQQFPLDNNRRGMGFDKPHPSPNQNTHVTYKASLKSFGHAGFTGTYTWADPSNDLLYVFLSNRIYPDANNRKINQLNIRTQIHEQLYEILQKSIALPQK